MKKFRFIVPAFILLLTIGFASLSTTLFINGLAFVSSDIVENGVYIDDVSMNYWHLSGDNDENDDISVGDELTIGTETFYVYDITPNNYKLISKYNLEVGNSTNSSHPASTETYLQSENAIGYNSSESAYATVNYESVENYLNEYKNKLISLGMLSSSEITLISKEELETFGCSSSSHNCNDDYSFITETSYWTSSESGSNVWFVRKNGTYSSPEIGAYNTISKTDNSHLGVRPVVIISKEDIVIETDKDKFTFALNHKNNYLKVKYNIVNKNTQYDAIAHIECSGALTSSINYSEDLFVEAQSVASSFFTVNKEDEASELLTCNLNYTLAERESARDQTYIVTFNPLGGSLQTEDESKNIIKGSKYGILPETTLKNYEFLGWFTEETGGTKIEERTIFNYDSNITLYAHWNLTCTFDVNHVWNFDYTGGEQEFKTPCEGIYKLETWGASGGDTLSELYKGGLGGYTSGNLSIKDQQTMYINVGGTTSITDLSNLPQSNSTISTTYNGGGGGYVWYSGNNPASIIRSLQNCGGGATHIAFAKGELKTLNEKRDKIILVAGGGGGAAYYYTYSSDVYFFYGAGGYGGGLVGGSGTSGGNSKAMSYEGIGGTQNGPGYALEDGEVVPSSKSGFGYGAPNDNATSMTGGGAGYFGGGAGKRSGGGGGSSYVTSDISVFSIVDGEGYYWTTKRESYSGMPKHDGTNDTMTGNSGNGYARITLISKS